MNQLQQVVDAGACVGCGSCAFAGGGHMFMDRYGFYQPALTGQLAIAPAAVVDSACPFLVPELNEDVLADRFLDADTNRDFRLGRFDNVFAAHVEEGLFRRRGSSGGIGTWLASELLARNLVDGVIHACPVVRNGREDPFFRYCISRTPEELARGAHSHYHVVEISQVMAEVKSFGGRYLFIGVPCMVKAVRRLQLLDQSINESIRFTVALVCGHLKSVHWALSLGWEAGTPPEDMAAITFRVKDASVPAKAYYFAVTNKRGGAATVHDSAALTGGKFNLGAMMPSACNYCDDVVGETADVTIGDAWLPRYMFDWRGKNMVISRCKLLSDLFTQAAAEGRVAIEHMSAKEAAAAQVGGFRQRREGLAYRLARRAKAGMWAPEKRALPDMKMPGFLRAAIYRLREQVASRSSKAFRIALDSNDLGIYQREMRSLFRRLRWLEIASSSIRIISVRLKFLFKGKQA